MLVAAFLTFVTVLEYFAGGDPLVMRAFALWGRLPAVPVRVVDPADVYDQRSRGVPQPPTAFVIGARDVIYVSRTASPYRTRHAEKIAACLAHEQAHLDGADESGAYAAQLALAERLARQRHWPDYYYLDELRKWVRR